mgnify:CR=1 FL=1|jgi:hypothetical protein
MHRKREFDVSSDEYECVDCDATALKWNLVRLNIALCVFTSGPQAYILLHAELERRRPTAMPDLRAAVPKGGQRQARNGTVCNSLL